MRHRKKIFGIAMALFASSAVQLAAQGPGKRGPTEDPASVERGEKQFVAACSFCHGVHAKGGEGGPDLLRSVLVLDDTRGDKIGPVILNGRPGTAMPKFAMTPEQISDIANFLHHSINAAAERGGYQILDIVTGNAAAGKAYFNGAGKCNTCHSVEGDLKGIGAKYDPSTLQGKFLMPRGRSWRRRGKPTKPEAPVTATVTLPSGQTFSGTLDHIDDFNVALTDASGDYHSFVRKGDVPKVELHDPLQFHKDMLMKYTDTDIHNLTAYLVTLK